jgi:hypothetical protein
VDVTALICAVSRRSHSEHNMGQILIANIEMHNHSSRDSVRG